MTPSELADFGWDSFFQQQLTDGQSPLVVPVRVMNVHKSGLQIAGVDVDTQVEPLSNDDDRATVGDWLLFDTETRRIVGRLDRKSIFKRRAPGTDSREQLIAANVDTLFIVSSSNTLLGNSDITTQAIRDDDSKGRHTTTSRTMHHLPGGAWLLDTPGMRELQLTDVRTGLDDVFAEITQLAATCRFVDCKHETEPGCAIRRAIDDDEIDIERLNRWRKLIKEEAYNSEASKYGNSREADLDCKLTLILSLSS